MAESKKTFVIAERIDNMLSALGRLLTGRPFGTAINNVRYARQRIARGWDDTAVWSLDTHLARTLGPQLLHLARTAHGFPAGTAYQTFEEWVADLTKHGEALTRYADGIFNYDLDEDTHVQLLEDAQAALHWVAEHLPSLWD